MADIYTDEEIRALYREAKNKKCQIGILADLKCCTKDEIRKIIFQKDEPKERKENEHHNS